ncbi:MAG: hypothetical protein OXC18_20765 [Desulfurellaceae bacterium]|nr:hypothetical protein [Desulfurellaceae bacterium]
MYDSIIAEVHEARWKLFEEAGCDLHVFFQHLREAQNKHRERVTELPRRSSDDMVSGSPPYAGSVAKRFRRVPSPKPSGLSE